MKKEIVEAFDSVEMPRECAQKIRCAMQERQTPVKKPAWRLHPVAAALAVVLLLFSMSTEVRAAVSNIVVKYFFPGSDITIYEETDENGEVIRVTAVDTEAPAFARMVNDRLYFTGNGEKIDITDQISEAEPYFYTYVDDYGLTHYLAVGYSGSIENFGIYEFIREEAGDWVTGTGRNFLDSKTETRYPWVDIVWEELGIPWPMPE